MEFVAEKNTLIFVMCTAKNHDAFIKWKHFPRNWPFVKGNHRSPVDSTYKGHSLYTPEQTVEQTMDTSAIWYATAAIT